MIMIDMNMYHWINIFTYSAKHIIYNLDSACIVLFFVGILKNECSAYFQFSSKH